MYISIVQYKLGVNCFTNFMINIVLNYWLDKLKSLLELV